MNLESGGWIPAAPGVVARRRYGDCKDLVWLATTVLRSWGLVARPVLVGTGLRERVASLLPMAILFNHAILEVESGGQTRWFDLTESSQGGNFETRSVGWFGQGLVISTEAGGLRAQPGTRARSVYALRETILLDTTRGAPSLAEHRLRAEGGQADNLRRARLGHGAEAFAKEREEQAKRRYGKARRAGTLQWRDDRESNVCELVDVYEIDDALYPGENDARGIFDVPPTLVVQGFGLPADKARRGPWDMPFPLDVTHEITIKSSSLDSGIARKRRWQEPEFEATLECPMLRGAWTRKVRFSVGAGEVATDRVPAYRRQLEELFKELGWRLYLPWGHGRSRRGTGFGELASADGSSPSAPVSDSSVETVRADVAINPNEAKLGQGESGRGRSSSRSGRHSSSSGSRRRSSSGRSRGGRGISNEGPDIPWWVIRMVIGFVAALAYLLMRGCMAGLQATNI